jgi:F0F1-type ATP synthase delta subunit
MKQVYIHAMLQVLESGVSIETALANLRQVLDKHGHLKILPQILSGLMVELEKATKNNIPKVILASDGAVSDKDIKLALEKISAPTKEWTTVIDSNIIGGLVATFNNKSLDQSYRTKLVDLYQSSVTA